MGRVLHRGGTIGEDRHHLGVLGEDLCLRLLGSSAVGRLGFSAGGLPVIYPVNYFLLDRTIVFCSEEGEKLHAARHGSVACLEVDEFDRFDHSGWSVLATGRLSVAAPERVEALRRLPLMPWAISTADRFIELSVDLVSGRVVGRP